MAYSLSTLEAAGVAAAGSGVSAWLYGGLDFTHAIGVGVLSGLAALGYAGYQAHQAAKAAAP